MAFTVIHVNEKFIRVNLKTVKFMLISVKIPLFYRVL